MEGKRSRINNNTDLVVDRISDLPDFILGDILSFLPTKEALATSILSKSWKFAWLTVHSLDFYYNYNDSKVARNEAENMKFVRFVQRVLLLIDAGPLNKFSLLWNALTISSSQLNSWINTAITRNVHKLYLAFGKCDVEELDTPLSVFTCDSLQSLELKGKIYVPAAIVVCLPRLENLKLHCAHFGSEEACEQLISGCPMLRYLYLTIDFTNNGNDDNDYFTCIISSASLRRLDIYFADRGRLKLKDSSLESLKVSGRIFEISGEKSLRSLVQVQLHDYRVLEDKREMIRYMLEHGSALEVMEISCYITGDGEKLELLQEICEFSRKSPTCKVQFTRGHQIDS